MEEFHGIASEVSRKTYQARLLEFRVAGDRPVPPGAGPGRRGPRIRPLQGRQSRSAYIFCPSQDGTLLYQSVGYDPEFEQWSPGTVLQYLVLESLFAEGRFQTFDFTEGKGAHKEFFANRSILCADIFYFRKALKNFLVVGLHAGLFSASRGSTRLLDRLGMSRRVKKLIRSKA